MTFDEWWMEDGDDNAAGAESWAQAGWDAALRANATTEPTWEAVVHSLEQIAKAIYTARDNKPIMEKAIRWMGWEACLPEADAVFELLHPREEMP